MSAVPYALNFLQSRHDFLAAQTDLSPANEGVNKCLNGLVTQLSSWFGTPLFNTLPHSQAAANLRIRLPELCGRAEGEMEKWWARRILAETCPAMRALNSFWYIDHYRELCHDEMALLATRNTRQLAFLGSGALPLTALIMAIEHPELSIRCVDYDEEACALSQRLVRSLNLTDRVTILHQSAEDFVPRSGECLLLASLLRAPALFEKLAAHTSSDILIRDAEGAYLFLYQSALRPASRQYREIGRSHASARRINTSLLYAPIQQCVA